MDSGDDILDYSTESVREALQLLCDGSIDPDPDRRADLIRALRSLPPEQATALVAAERGYSMVAIAKRLCGKSQSVYGLRLLTKAFANLRMEINGRRKHVTTRPTRRAVQR